MNTIFSIPKNLFLLMFVLFTLVLSGCTSKSTYPDVNNLADDMVSLMQKTNVDFGKNQQKLSDYYKLISFEGTNRTEVGERIYRIEFKGEVELIETIYNYGKNGYRRYFMPSRLRGAVQKGQVNKGTVIVFTGSADYELTENGWSNEKKSLLIKSRLARKT